MRESEADYRELFEGNPQPMWVCNRQAGEFLAVNDAALLLYGYGRIEFLELSLSRLLPDEKGFDRQAHGDQVSTGRQMRRDGSFFEAELTWHPCEFQGEQAHLVLVREKGGAPKEERDSFSEHQLAAQLEATQHELETFSYSISHDLQAPLRHIDGFSRALIDDYAHLLDTQAKEYLARICQSAAKMSQLIEALQQLSRVTRSELKRQPVNLTVTAQVIALELKRSAPQRQVEFTVEEGVSVDADARLSRQLLEILIGNAWKFTSRTEKAAVEFGARSIDGEKVYFVKDNGAGFDMEYMDKLFTIFHRLHRADEFEGSGVGLAIAHRIVARHGGRIWAEGAPDRGATFYFTL